MLPKPPSHTTHRAYVFQNCWRKKDKGKWKFKSMSGDKWKSQLQAMPFVIQADLDVICDQGLLVVRTRGVPRECRPVFFARSGNQRLFF